MGRKFVLALALLGIVLLAGCGGGTGIASGSPNNGNGTNGVSSSSLASSQTSVNFGSTALSGSQSASVILTNSAAAGGSSISITQLSISGSAFAVAPAITLPQSLAAGQSLTVGLEFAPTVAGAATGSLAVASNAANGNITVSLAGIGLAPGQLGVNPNTLAFGNVTVGTTAQLSGSLAAGSSDVTVSSIAWTGTGYSISGISFPVIVSAGTSVPFTITFTPNATGSFPGTISFLSNASNSPAVETLTGSGVQSSGPPPPPNLTVSPASLSFGNVAIGNSKQLGGTLIADSGDVTVSSIAWTGQGYSISGISFPVTVPDGQSVGYTVTFTPTVAGSSTGTLSFVSNAANSPSSQTLSGNGYNPGPPAGAISAGFFGMDVGNNRSPWPYQLGTKVGFFRTLGAQMRWSDVEPTCDGGSDPTNPCYNWTTFDQWATQATTGGQEILYTAYYTPPWVSSNPTATCQYVAGDSQSPPPGGCYPPVDVETGDQHWKDYVTAVYMHAATTPGLEKIKYWECWNEPNVPAEYSNNNSNNALSDLNTMCSDLRTTIRALDSTTKFTTPAPTLGPGVITWQKSWINAGYANYADYIGYHGYVCNNPATCSPSSAESEQTAILAPLQAFIATTKGTPNDVTHKLLWDTEGSDDAQGVALADPDQHAAFYARFTLLQQSAGVAEFSDWGWDFGGGNSFVNNPGDPNGTLNEAGIAWEQIYSWTVGSAYQTPCANTSGTVWQCTLTDGITTSLIVWDTAQTCLAGVCTTSSFKVPSPYKKSTNLAGNSSAIIGGVTPIGAKPVLLQ